MAGWDGAGNFTVTYTFEQDRINAIKVRSDRMDQNMDDIIAGLENAMTLTGETTPTANIPLGSNKITGLSDGEDAGDAVNMSQLQDGSATTYTATGASGAYAITAAPAITAYAANQRFIFKANDTNSGEPTLNVSALGVKTIKKDDGSIISNGQIKTGMFCEVVYDGTNFIITSPLMSTYASYLPVTTTPVTPSDDYSAFFVNTSSAAKTLNIPTGAGRLGWEFDVIDVSDNAATNNITLTPNGAELLNGANSSIVINTDSGTKRVTCIASNAYVVR